MSNNNYPPNWMEIAVAIKAEAGWKCEHCGHFDDYESGHVLTVHHLDGDKANCTYENLVALCQRCHLHWQHRYIPGQLMMFRPEWMVKRGIGG